MSRSPFTNVSSPAGLLNSPTFRSRRNHLLLEARRRRHVGRRDHSACPCGTPASGASLERASSSRLLHWARCPRCGSLLPGEPRPPTRAHARVAWAATSMYRLSRTVSIGPWYYQSGRVRRTRGDREHQRTRLAPHAVHAPGRAAGVVAGGARARVVGHAALQHEDLLVADVPVARDGGARLVAHQDRLVETVGIFPQHLPEHSRAALGPGQRGHVDEQADGWGGHG